MTRTIALLLPALMFAAPAQAQERIQGDDPYAACATLGDDAARLSCFDETYSQQAVVRVEQSRRAEEEARRAEQQRIEEERLAAQRAIDDYGLQREAEEGRGARNEVASVTSKVAETFTDGLGRALVTLENGQVWREVNGSSLRVPPGAGAQATVEEHWSGAYTMTFEGRRGFLRVQRYR